MAPLLSQAEVRALMSKIARSSYHRDQGLTLRVALPEDAVSALVTAGLPRSSEPAGAFVDLDEGEGLVGLGEARALLLAAPQSTEQIERTLVEARRISPPDHAGWLGGARFDPERAPGSGWGELGAAWWFLPLVFVEQRAGRRWLGAHLVEEGDRRRAQRVLEGWARERPPTDGRVGLGWRAPLDEEHDYRTLVREAERACAQGALDKVVLSRRWSARLSSAGAPSAALARLAVSEGTGVAFHLRPHAGRGFFGLSPERLYVREGRRLRVDALAGTARRGRDAVEDRREADRLLQDDKERREHAFVVDGIRRRLTGAGASLDEVGPPGLRHLQRIMHLHTSITATLDEERPVLSALHPTPAVCGTPLDEARRWIRDREGYDRGLYTGPVGWLTPGGERMAVALRCARYDLDEGALTAFAGAGVVQGSRPERELEETERKLEGLVAALSSSVEAAA